MASLHQIPVLQLCTLICHSDVYSILNDWDITKSLKQSITKALLYHNFKRFGMYTYLHVQSSHTV